MTLSTEFNIKANIEATDKASEVFERLKDVVVGATGVIVAQFGLRAFDAVRSFVSSSVDAFSGFESSVAKIVAATGVVGEEAERLRNRFSEVVKTASLQFGVSSVQVAGALESLVKAGLDGEAAVKALNSAVQMSVVEQISSSESANLLVSTLAQFRLTAEDSSRAVDALTNASRLGIGSANEYAGGLSYVGAASNALGFSLEETLSALVLIDATQKDAVKSGRLLNAAFSDLITHQDKLSFFLYDSRGNMLSLDEVVKRLTETLSGFGSQAERDAYLNEVFGEQGRRAALALLGQSEALVDLTGKMNQAGAANEMFSTQMDTFRGRMAKAQAAVEAFQTKVGAALAPVVVSLTTFFIENVMPTLEALFSWLSKVGNIVTEHLTPVWKKLEEAGRLLSDSIQELADAFGFQSDAAEETGSTLAFLIGVVLEKLIDILYFVAAVVKTVTAAWNTWKDLIDVLRNSNFGRLSTLLFA